jgi:transposase
MNVKTTSNPSILWAGCDLAKATFDVAIWGHQAMSDMCVRHVQRRADAIPAVLEWLRQSAPEGARIGIVMEATGPFSEETARWFLTLDPGLIIAIVNPALTCAFIRSLGLRNKTDLLDAKALAVYGRDRSPIAWEPPTKELVQLRDLVRTRAELIDAQTAMKLRLRDHDRSSKTATTALEQVLVILGAQIEILDAEIEAMIGGNEVWRTQSKHFRSIKGVGPVTVATILAELGDLRRFLRSRQLSAFAGVSPRKKDSGTSVRGKARMCKQGSARVRAVLYMAASCAVRFNPDMKMFYEHLLAQGKERRSALGAIMRKLLVVMRALAKSDKDYLPCLVAA